MLAELPYEDRFMLYGAWRGHGMEKYALGVKHPQYAVAEVSMFSFFMISSGGKDVVKQGWETGS